MAIDNYGSFYHNPSRRDVYIYDVYVKDDEGVDQVLRWAREDKSYSSGPEEDPPNVTWEKRVLEGGIEYQSPSLDPHNPNWGVQPAPTPPPMVVLQIDGDLDQYRAWRWGGARIEVRHGGYTEDGWLPLEHWRTVNVVEVDKPPTFGLDRVTLTLRNRDSRFDHPAEGRKLAAFAGCIEFDGAESGVDFYPLAPGVRVRSRRVGSVSDQGNIDVPITVPDGTKTGDLLRLRIASHGNDVAGTYQAWSIPSPPAGWTERQAAVSSVGGVAAHRLYCYTRVADSADEAGASYNFDGTGTACSRTWEVVAWYGVDGSTPVVDSDETSPDTVDASGDAPSVDTTRVGDVLDCGWSSMSGADSPVPTGMIQLASISKRTTTSNRSTLKTAYEVRGTTGATGVRTLTLNPSSRHAADSLVVGNRASGGAPAKLDLRNALTIQFPLIPYGVSGTQHLLGWETSPFRVFLEDEVLTIGWEDGGTPVTVEAAFEFVAWRRYDVAIVVADTGVTFLIHDWWSDAETIEVVAGGGFHGRDVYAAGEHFTLGFNYNGGSPTDFYEGQIWPVRIWNTEKAVSFLQDARMRPLTEAEELASDLLFYLPMEERTGLLVGDRSASPADGNILQTTTGPTTLSAVAAAAGVRRKFTRASGSFVTDGWVAGRAGISTGWTKANNNGRFFVLTVAALTLEIEGLELEAETGGGNELLVSDDWRPTLTGTPDQLNQQVPCAFGGPFEEWPGMPVESGTDGSFFLVHPVNVFDIEAVYEGGGPRLISIEHNDYRAFVGTLPDVGTASIFRGDVGSFYRLRIHSMPTSCLLWGDAYDGTFVRTAADIARRLMTTRGEEPLDDPDDLVTASITALNTLCPHPIQAPVTPGDTIRDVVRRALGTIGAVTWPRRDGKFDFARFDGETGSPTKTIHRKNWHEDSLTPVECEPPVVEVRARFRKNWQRLERDQIDGNVEGRFRLAFLLTEWRSMRPRRDAVATEHDRPRTLPFGDEEFLELYFCEPARAWHHAAAECNRLLDLFDTVPQCFDVAVRQATTAPTEFLEQVTVRIEDIDRDNALRTRLGVGTKTFVTIGVADDKRSGLEKLRIWRKDQEA